MAGTYKNLSNVVLGNMATFNMQHGYSEAVVRGMRSSFLADSDYHHITQCDNLEVSGHLDIPSSLKLYYCQQQYNRMYTQLRCHLPGVLSMLL